jgi:membrane protein implicated in regulation of membrane protease activity
MLPSLEMLWWYWLLLGLALLGLEIATPGTFYFLFPGVAALLVGVLALAGVAGPDWAEWALFSVLSVILLTLARKPLVAKMKTRRGEGREPEIVGEEVTLLEDVPPGEVGKGELRGSTWSVRNGGDATLRSRQRCRVERVDGLTLWVRVQS